MKKVLIIKHIENEDAGTIADFLDERRIQCQRVRLHAGEHLPERLDDISAIVMLGGPMNVYEEDKHPFLKEEDAFIKKALRGKVPFFGVCLGAQLLAKACGAKVYKAPQAEVGVCGVELCDDIKKSERGIFKSAPNKFFVVQWHEDTFDVPDGGKLLITSDTCKNQAFRINENAYGLQFHIEADDGIVRDWFGKMKTADKINKEFSKISDSYSSFAQEIYANFFGIKP